MALHHTLGKNGELLAQAFLEERGYAILETNWRYKKAEVDLVAIAEGKLIIVEVKTRTSDTFGDPAEAVTKNKKRLLSEAANEYLQVNQLNLEIQFDIISIITNKEETQIQHIPDAFYPFSTELDG